MTTETWQRLQRIRWMLATSIEGCGADPMLDKEWLRPAWRCGHCKSEVKFTVGIGWHHHKNAEETQAQAVSQLVQEVPWLIAALEDALGLNTTKNVINLEEYRASRELPAQALEAVA